MFIMCFGRNILIYYIGYRTLLFNEFIRLLLLYIIFLNKYIKQRNLNEFIILFI